MKFILRRDKDNWMQVEWQPLKKAFEISAGTDDSGHYVEFQNREISLTVRGTFAEVTVQSPFGLLTMKGEITYQ